MIQIWYVWWSCTIITVPFFWIITKLHGSVPIFMVSASLVGHGLNFLAQDFSIELGQIASCLSRWMPFILTQAECHSARIPCASYALHFSHYPVTVWQGIWCISRVSTSTLSNPSFANIRSISTILSKTPTKIGSLTLQSNLVKCTTIQLHGFKERQVVLAQGSTNKVHHNLGQSGKKGGASCGGPVANQHLQVRWNHKN